MTSLSSKPKLAFKMDIRRGIAVGLLAGVVSGAIACSSGEGQGAGGTGEPGAGEPISGTGGSGGTFFLDGGPPADAPGAVCATSSATASLLPSWLQFVVDISGSMLEQAYEAEGFEPPHKWEVTRDALLNAMDALPANTRVGVILFPDSKATADVLCFSNRADVPFALLDAAHEQLIHQVLGSVIPMGATPTEDAYLFALQSFAGVRDANKFVVLITDGQPTVAKDCQGNGMMPGVPTEPLVAAAAAAAAEGVRTFVIGSPGSELCRSGLSAMAEKGGTGPSGCSNSGPNYCHLDMTAQADFSKAITDALLGIAGSISCVFDIPVPEDGSVLDPDNVNVVFSPNGGDSQYILQDANENCEDGWRYSPDGTQIVLCKETCKTLQSDGNGKIDIEFGCKTKTTNPR